MGPGTDGGVATLRNAIRSIPDFPKPGILFRDFTPLLEDAVLFRQLIDLLARECADLSPSKVVGLDARGFIVGAALAHRLGLGFVPVRKRGKLPAATISQPYDLEYGQSELEIHTDSVSPGEPVVLVDDLLATGGTARAALQLLGRLGARVEWVLVVVELSGLGGRAALAPAGVRSLISYAE